MTGRKNACAEVVFLPFRLREMSEILQSVAAHEGGNASPLVPSPSAGAPRAGGPLRRLRYRLEFGVFWCIAKIAEALPLDLCARWSSWCWRRVGRHNKRQRRALAQLALALPELGQAAHEAILDKVWDNLGRVFAESFHFEDFMQDKRRYEMLREAELQEFIARTPSFVIASLHTANWELAALGPLRAGLRIAGIYQAIKNPYVDAYVTRLRGPLYPAALLAKSPSTPRRFLKLMREGITVAMMSDLREARGVEVPFFGRPAPSTAFPGLLAVTHEVPILAVRTLRLPNSHFQFDWTVLHAVRTYKTRDENVKATTALLQGCFEAWVRERPGEWMWVHRRWV